jgi:hypothetical protein
MKRVILGVGGLFVLAAVATRAAEATGRFRRCGCTPDCWCQKPGLSLFRWVVPKRHRSVDPAEKEARARAAQSH